MLNKEAVILAIMAGLALECDIQGDQFGQEKIIFPDLKGISNFSIDHPLFGWRVVLDDLDKVVRVTRIHMERR